MPPYYLSAVRTFAVFAFYSSIEVTPELDLKIYIKGGYEITEKYLPLKNSA